MLAAAPKQPPHSMEGEQSIIGGLLLNNRAWYEVSEIVSVEDFYVEDHRVIFRHIAALLNAGKPCDFLTLTEYMRKLGTLEDAGGVSYLGTLAADTPSAANVRAYAEIVRERALLRGLIAAGQDIAEMGYQPGGRPVEDLVGMAEQSVFAMRRQRKEEARGYDAIIDGIERKLETARETGPIHGAYTGYTDFDTKTNGLHDGDLIIIGGRPSMGKTTLALNLAEFRAQQDDPVAIFSMEMTQEQLGMRSIASIARIDQEAIRTGTMDMEQWDRYGLASGRLRGLPIQIDDTRGLTLAALRNRAKRLKMRHGIRLVVVDYIQLMSTPGRENRTTEIGEVSRGLKILAGELQVPVIALAQLSRTVEARADRRPMMSDLRESGGIEQDADVIVFVYRDEVYDKKSNMKGTAEIVIAKQRTGPTGMVRLAYLPHYSRFDNLAPGWREPSEEKPEPKKSRGFDAGEPPQHWSDR